MGERDAPFDPTAVWNAQPWLDEATAWVDAQLRANRIRRTGPVERSRVRFWSVLLTVPTDAGLFWFKENNIGESAEAAVIAMIATFAPENVVVPLAIDPGRGWLLSPDHRPTLRSLMQHDAQQWIRIVTDYARLQQLSAAREQALLDAGLRNLHPAHVVDDLVELVGRLTSLPGHDARRVDEHLSGKVARLVPRLGSAARSLCDGDVPMSLEHNDLHPGNVFVPAADEEVLRLFDFGEAVWAHPFSSMYLPVRVLTADWSTTGADPRIHAVLDAYLGCWSGCGSPAALRTLLHAALEVAAIHRIDSWDRLLAHASAAVTTDGYALPRWLTTLTEDARQEWGTDKSPERREGDERTAPSRHPPLSNSAGS